MPIKTSSYPGMSNLERQFEIEMGEEPQEQELENEFQVLAEPEEEPSEGEIEGPEDGYPGYAERFYELSVKGFESETEVDDAIQGLLGEMERDFFFKGLMKKLKKGGKALLKKGLTLAKGLPPFQAAKGITQLARGNMKGFLGSLAKAGIAAAVPGGAAIVPVMSALGFEASDDPEQNRGAWDTFVNVSREAYDYLGRNLESNSDEPLRAGQLASQAFQYGLKKAALPPTFPSTKEHAKVIYLKKGEHIVIKAI